MAFNEQLLKNKIFNNSFPSSLVMIKEIIRTLLPFCTSPEPMVYRAGLDCFSSLSLLSTELRQLDDVRS
jgi:hypothetical protein